MTRAGWEGEGDGRETKERVQMSELQLATRSPFDLEQL